MSRPIGSAGLALIKKFEGCRLEAYQDVARIWTIGYGHTSGVTAGMNITEVQAEEYLKEDCQRFADAVDGLGRDFNDNQRDALISFAFNLGENNLKKVTVNNRSCEDIAQAMPLYCSACGEKLQGLVDRRNAEVKLFNTPCASVVAASAHVHGIGEVVTVSSYYNSSTDEFQKAIYKTLENVTVGRIVDNVHNPYRLDRDGVAMGWCNDGDIRVDGIQQESVQIHVVQAGETLSKIARQYGTTVENLVSLNGIGNPNEINVGQPVKIS
jgi:GH24 family phage-related lysozyme (muramidase)